jgi:hypothetical protein
MLAEAAEARAGLADAASQIADDARVGAKSLQVHARRAALAGATAANDAIESGMQVGAQAWREARRQAAEWGSTAIAQARSRPATVVVGVAIVGVAVGFWLRGSLRRESVAARKPRKARARA